MDACITDPVERAKFLAKKIKHALLTEYGRSLEEASSEEFSFIFCSTLLEEISTYWRASLKRMEVEKTRRIYYLSMEYLPGKLLPTYVSYLSQQEFVGIVLKELGRSYEEVLEHEVEAALGNGGLGRLASCYLDSLAFLQYPTFGYGLRYQYGIFEQQIWGSNQVERPDCWLLYGNPWEKKRDHESLHIQYAGEMLETINQSQEKVNLLRNSEEVRVVPFDLPIIGYPNKEKEFTVVTLRLWSTKESPRNFQLQRYNAGFLDQAAENTSLTDVLYPNDNTEMGKRVRLKQEYLLSASSIKDILRRHLATFGTVEEFADKVRIQINDTHPALAIVELVRLLMQKHDHTLSSAWEVASTCCNYTNHTLLKESLEEWNEDRLAQLLPRQYEIIKRVDDLIRPKEAPPICEGGQVKMAPLSILGSHRINGVSALHSELVKETLFPEWVKFFPEKFVNVTNGVTHRRWLMAANPLLSAFITEKIGPEWQLDFSQIVRLKEVAEDKETQEAFLQIKKANKERLIDFLLRHHAYRDASGKLLSIPQNYSSDAIFDMQIKRIHEYKRQLLAVLHAMLVYFSFQKNKTKRYPRLLIFAGKAAPGYWMAKGILQLIDALSRKLREDEEVSSFLQVVFFENYNVTRAEYLIPAADLSEQISTAGYEASGTGNMKLTMNGALTIGTEDGANVEMRQSVTDAHWPFRFGGTIEEIKESYHPVDIYSQDEGIQEVLNSLRDGYWTDNPDEQAMFSYIYQDLISMDRYRILKDLRSYAEIQQRVEDLYQQPQEWAKTALYNIAGMGPFSSDRSVQDYARDVWDLKPVPFNKELLHELFEEYCATIL